MACVAFIVVLPIEYTAQYFFNKNILFTNQKTFNISDEDIANSYPFNVWLCLLIAINSLVIRYNFKDLDSETLNSFNTSQLLILIGWLLGLTPGFIAYKKGRNFFNWWMYGHLLFIVAFPHSLLLKETEKSLINKGIFKKCPYCAEVVKKEAKVCKHCGNQLN
ncbi:MAG: zinc ribbon domain-containing protein [Nostoc sp.]|uniref:zinc ribbon domain-containing protein n=1 Tax=Nostoc sp. TaxID=1180 RepID=UPI002FF8E5E6